MCFINKLLIFMYISTTDIYSRYFLRLYAKVRRTEIIFLKHKKCLIKLILE
jgi:hypothetical protein